MYLKQIQDYCTCTDINEADVDELINLISNATCWAQKPCETFLLESRKEVVDVPHCLRDCSVFTFEPFYTPFNTDSFTFTLIEQDGIEETEIPITDFKYSVADENFRLLLPLPDCNCTPDCGCEKTYKLIVEYEAGYEDIPECLLPLMCQALQWIYDKNNCDCSDCEPCNNERTIVNVIDTSTFEGRIEDYFKTFLMYQYRRQLSLISLCQGMYRHLWGVVV